MRLLQRLSKSNDFSLVERFGGDIPPYAILSHTWGSNEDEVTFLDLQDEQVKNDPGYSKLVFCSKQAAKDKLEFFWVDTCCIDKSSSAELSEAINSMFKWYQKAERCYVLLSDVTIDRSPEDISQQEWAQIFHESRWFQRGWTLQEMLAPKVVDFFSKTGTRLGDKVTLLQAHHLRTLVPILALQGSPLPQFSIDDRMSWMEGRQTKREEDAAYSLLGLLGVHMSLLYGEGRERALARLRRKAERSLNNLAPVKPPASRPRTSPFQPTELIGARDHSGKQLGPVAHGDDDLPVLNALDSTSLANTYTAARASQHIEEIAVRYPAPNPGNELTALNEPDIVYHLTTAIEDLYEFLPALRARNPTPDIVYRLTTTIENLYNCLPVLRATHATPSISSNTPLALHPTKRAIQPEQSTSNILPLELDPTRRDLQPEQPVSNIRPSGFTPSEMTTSMQLGMVPSIVAGTDGLMQLGLSISELALLIDQGTKFGNFIRVEQNDNELFDILGEDREAILRRRDLVDGREMEKRWPYVQFFHQGVRRMGKITRSLLSQSSSLNADQTKRKKDTDDGVDRFTWVMVAITSALEECLPFSRIRKLLTGVFVKVLKREDESDYTANALRIHLKRNIRSWTSFGCAREIASSIKKEMRKSLSNGMLDQPHIRAIPRLNETETEDVKNMLVWLLNGDATVFSAMYPITFSIAEAWKNVRLDLCTDGNPTHERQGCVVYRHMSRSLRKPNFSTIEVARGSGSIPVQISWPRDKPESMIDVLGVGHALGNAMSQAWQHGEDAADHFELMGKADGSDGQTNQVYYTLQFFKNARVSKRFGLHIRMLANRGFPADTEEIYSTLEWILQGEPADSLRWLQNHVGQDYPLRVDNTGVHTVHEKRYKSVYFKYQAFMFGFYYQLLRQLLVFDLVDSTAFFHGIWATHSTTFLAMCTQLGCCLRRDGKVNRAHILYVLAAMYDGRVKHFDTSLTPPRLVAVLGRISLLALPLIRTTDDPKEIWKIAVVDRPIADLFTDNVDGDLMASEG